MLRKNLLARVCRFIVYKLFYIHTTSSGVGDKLKVAVLLKERSESVLSFVYRLVDYVFIYYAYIHISIFIDDDG